MTEGEDLLARVQAQQELIDDLQAKVAANEHLEARLAHLERLVAGASGAPPIDAAVGRPAALKDSVATPTGIDELAGDEPEAATAPALTDRRHLLTKAATVAAGAVAGGTALAIA